MRPPLRDTCHRRDGQSLVDLPVTERRSHADNSIDMTQRPSESPGRENVNEAPRSAVTVASPLVCIECRRPWLIGRERWRMKVDDGEPRETVSYCPDCAAREFGP
jgi:hypothetical protein